MSHHTNPYAKKLANVDTAEDDNVSMKDNSPIAKDSSFEEEKQEDNGTANKEDWSQDKEQLDEEEINFEEQSFQILPSFSCPISEEPLCDDNHPYVFWKSLQLPIAKDPVNPMAAVYDALKEFVAQMAEEDPPLHGFPYNLSNYESIEDLLPPIKTMDDLLDNTDKWLMYFPEVKPRISSGNTYMALLIG